jgi:hypothetical protein
MPELSSEEALEILLAPRTIYAPDGTTFTLRLIFDPPSAAKLFESGEMSYEMRGPRDNDHLWLANSDGYLIPDPSHDDIPSIWSLKVELALTGWLALEAAANSG